MIEWGAIGAAVMGALAGAIVGGAIAALVAGITGGDITTAALYGAIGGAISGGIGGWMGASTGGATGGSAAGYTGQAVLVETGVNTAPEMTGVVGTAGGTAGESSWLAGFGEAFGDIASSEGWVGLAGDVVSGVAAGKQTQAQIEAQQAEADKTRAFNTEENAKNRALQESLANISAGYNWFQAKSSDAKWRAELAEGRRQFDVTLADTQEQRQKSSNALEQAQASRSLGSYVESPSILAQTVETNKDIQQTVPTIEGGTVAYG